MDVNIRQIVRRNDSSRLLHYLDDVTDGNLPLEDIDADPAVVKAFKLSQYTAQYMLHCNSVLQRNSSSWKSRLDKKEQTLNERRERLASQVCITPWSI